MSDYNIREDDLIDNPSARVPVALCLDVSPSMTGDPKMGAPAGTKGVPIDELNKGVRMFYESIVADSIARNAVDLAIVTYSYAPFVIRDFGSIDEEEQPPKIDCELEKGGTHLGTAVERCLDMLDARKESYKAAGVEYYQPWLVLMTDGFPTEESHLKVAPRVKELVDSKKLTVFPLAIGEGAHRDTLQLMSPGRPVLTLIDLRFSAFFEWLSMSIQSVARSQPDEDIELDTSNILGNWGKV